VTYGSRTPRCGRCWLREAPTPSHTRWFARLARPHHGPASIACLLSSVQGPAPLDFHRLGGRQTASLDHTIHFNPVHVERSAWPSLLRRCAGRRGGLDSDSVHVSSRMCGAWQMARRGVAAVRFVHRLRRRGARPHHGPRVVGERGSTRDIHAGARSLAVAKAITHPVALLLNARTIYSYYLSLTQDALFRVADGFPCMDGDARTGAAASALPPRPAARL